MTFTQTR